MTTEDEEGSEAAAAAIGMHPPATTNDNNHHPLSPQIISKRSASDVSYKTYHTSSVSTTPMESPASQCHEDAADGGGYDAEDRDLPASTSSAAVARGNARTVPEDCDFEEGGGGRRGDGDAATGENSREGAVVVASTPERPPRPAAPGTPAGEAVADDDDAHPSTLSPDTPRFAEFMDFISRPSEEEEIVGGDDDDGATPPQALRTDDDFPDALSRVVSDFRQQSSVPPPPTPPTVPSPDAMSPPLADNGEGSAGGEGRRVEGSSGYGGGPANGSTDGDDPTTAEEEDGRGGQQGAQAAPPPLDDDDRLPAADDDGTSMNPDSPDDDDAGPKSRLQSHNHHWHKKYMHYSNRYPSAMDDFVSASNSKTKVGRRCYRLNLERPFDIHCEQSPLEYGDYMAPWTKEVHPDTVGPTEYCPPRHLGGEELAWRDLARWGEAAAAANSAEEKVNSLDQLDDDNDDRDDDDDDATGDADGPGMRGAREAGVGTLPTGGWRTLPDAEVAAVRRLGDRDDRTGELTFRTYDLSHLALNTSDNAAGGGSGSTTAAVAAAGMVMRNGGVSTDAATGRHGVMVEGVGIIPLRTVFSMDSTTSEDERANPKSPEDMAEDTARLFRRSELSLREKAEREDREEAERAEGARLAEIERRERKREMEMQRERETGMLGEDSPLDRSSRGRSRRGGGGGGGGVDLSKSGRTARRMSKGGKKLFKQLSKAFDSTGSGGGGDLGSSWRGNSSGRRSGSARSGIGAGGERPKMVKRSSMQALTIDKARDLVDESDDEGSVIGEEENSEDKKLNVSLYILGEYDILNDLVNDGAKRLRENKESSDLNLLLQNEPCPPPDRWVRTTAWGKCNPSSNYAIDPPDEFDWVRYNDSLRLRRDEYMERQVWTNQQGELKVTVRKGATTDTQTTETTADDSDDQSEDQRHRVGGRLTSVTRAGVSASSNPPEPPARRSSTTTGGGAKSHFNRNPSENLSASVRPARHSSRFSSSKSSSSSAAASGGDSLSMSARTSTRSSRFSSSSKSSSSAAPAASDLSASARTPRTPRGGAAGSRVPRAAATRAASDAAAVDSLSASARMPRAKGQYRATSDNLSASARTPRRSSTSKPGFGRKMSSMMGRKKSSGLAE